MRLLPALAAAFVVCLLATALPALPAQAVCIPPPEITLSPDWGVPGDSVTLSGQHCGDRKWIDIYYAGVFIEEVQANAAGRFSMTIRIPESHRGKHELLAVIGNDQASAYFDARPGLTVSPDRGPAGTTLTVTGHGFARDETILDVRYYLAGAYETVAENTAVAADGSWQVSLQVPSSTAGQHKIDARGSATMRAAVRPAVFEVTPGITLGMTSGSVDQRIMVNGSGFAPGEQGIRILLDGRAVRAGITADSQGYWQTNFQVPEMARGTYILTAEGESTQRTHVGELPFAVGPGIILSPYRGHVGMELTVSGRGFAANRDVTIMYDGHQVGTTITSDEGSFDVSFSVPESRHGERPVIARVAPGTDGSADPGTNASTLFTMESEPPPTPRPISPSAGARVGLLYQATPTFEWSQVEDDSGVRYRLQIATSGQLTEGASFADPIVSAEGLTGTSYTPQTGPLPYGRYYWIVQAVDGADNEGGWSEVYSFRVGLLPRWGFIVAIVVIAVLLLALLRFVIIRRTYYY
jgi:hypothetical protein